MSGVMVYALQGLVSTGVYVNEGFGICVDSELRRSSLHYGRKILAKDDNYPPPAATEVQVHEKDASSLTCQSRRQLL